jgi:hypothetical protein
MAVPKVVLVTSVLALLTLGMAGNSAAGGPHRKHRKAHSGGEVLLEKRGVSFIKSTHILWLKIVLPNETTCLCRN